MDNSTPRTKAVDLIEKWIDRTRPGVVVESSPHTLLSKIMCMVNGVDQEHRSHTLDIMEENLGALGIRMAAVCIGKDRTVWVMIFKGSGIEGLETE